MNRTLDVAIIAAALSAACSQGHGQAKHGAQMPERPTSPMKQDADIPLRMGGTGGVYFLASPGELVVEVEKRDRHVRDRHTDLRAILVGPDRRVIEDVTIPDDGRARGSGMGPPQRARLSARVDRKGVYALNVTVSQDRYGDEIAWGFRTNCPHYLIETSRGHRDRRREEPIVLLNPDVAGDVVFMPRRGEFGIEVTNIPDGVDALPVYDANGALVDTLAVNDGGRASRKIPAEGHRDAVPWRLHLPKHQATIQIDGVTRWDRNDLFVNLPYWTPDPKSWFPFLEYRWLLTPYSRIVHGRAGDERELAFRVHNNSARKATVRLAVEFPDEPWPAHLSANDVVLGSKRGAEVTVQFEVPPAGETRVCHIRATPAGHPDFSTYSTLTVKAGAPRAARPLDMPIVLKPYQHENEQFGYLPNYPIESEMYFDLHNRPFVAVGGGIAALSAGKWPVRDLRTAVKSRSASLEGASLRRRSTKIAFDRDNDVYILATGGGRAALLHSTDEGKTFAAYEIPLRKGQGHAFDIEQFSGHDVPDGPPPVLCYTRTARDPRLIWRMVNDLELFVPRKENGRISVGEPILISRKCIGLSAHSGIPASVVSRGNRVHVAWAEATDPDERVPGVPTYVVTFDRKTRRLGKPALVGYGPPANDVHNSPSITMDSQGYLHVLVGTHGRPFTYARSLKPNSASDGWTDAVPLGEGLRQTYIGMVCGPDDTLHAVFRLWRSGVEPFPNSTHATLAYQRKRPGQPWEPPRVLLVSAFSEYSVFYHRLTIDRRGRLFLSYDYWSTYWFYRTDHVGSRRSLMMSPDGGETWKLVEMRDLQGA